MECFKLEDPKSGFEIKEIQPVDFFIPLSECQDLTDSSLVKNSGFVNKKKRDSINLNDVFKKQNDFWDVLEPVNSKKKKSVINSPIQKFSFFDIPEENKSNTKNENSQQKKPMTFSNSKISVPVVKISIGYFPMYKTYKKIVGYSNGKNEILEMTQQELDDHQKTIKSSVNSSIKSSDMNNSVAMSSTPKFNQSAEKVQPSLNQPYLVLVLVNVENPTPVIIFKRPADVVNQRFIQMQSLVDQTDPVKKTQYHKIDSRIFGPNVGLKSKFENPDRPKKVSLNKEGTITLKTNLGRKNKIISKKIN